MINFEMFVGALIFFSSINAVIVGVCVNAVFKEIGKIPSGNHTSTWFTIEKCEVVLVPEEDIEEVKP